MLNKTFVNPKLILGIMGSLTIMALLFSSQVANSNPDIDATIFIDEHMPEYGVAYYAAVDNTTSTASAHIEYKSDSEEDIERYVAFSQQKFEELAKHLGSDDSIPVEVTFAAPLSKAQFTEFATQYALDIDHYQMYFVRGAGDLSRGDLTTVQGTPSDSELISPAELALMEEGVRESAGSDVRFVGWVSVKGRANATAIRQMNRDKRVFLADATDQFMANLLTESTLRQTNISRRVYRQILNEGFTDIYRAPLAYSLVKVGLMDID